MLVCMCAEQMNTALHCSSSTLSFTSQQTVNDGPTEQENTPAHGFGIDVWHGTQTCIMTEHVNTEWIDGLCGREAQAMGGVYSSTVPTKSRGTTASLTNETKHHHFP